MISPYSAIGKPPLKVVVADLENKNIIGRNAMNDLVSIIVPIYNVEKYINRCIKSIVDQTYRNIEIILVDDGSPDSCPEICDNWSKLDTRIKVIHKINGGLSDARNCGVSVATGAYICFLDSDDWIENTFVQILLEALQRGADVAECATRLFDEQDNTLQVRGLNRCLLSQTEALKHLVLEDGVYQTVADKMYKRELILDMPFKIGKYHEDDFWTWKVLQKIDTLAICEQPLYNYLQRSTGITGSLFSLKRLDGVEARYERWQTLKYIPEIGSLAKMNFLDNCIYNLQCSLCFLEKTDREKAIDIIGHYCDEVHIDDREYITLSTKKRFWYKLFLKNPVLTAKLRNIIGIGK